MREVTIKTCSGFERYVWLDGALVRPSDLNNLMPESAFEEWKKIPRVFLRRWVTREELLQMYPSTP